MYFPLRHELFTFSTGFSTVFVKKTRSFPWGFPLFPPCFQQQKRIDPIHAVIRAASFWKVLDKNAGILPFIKKKVEVFSLHSTNRFRAAIYFFQSGMNRLKVFNTGSPLFSCVEKAGKSAVFHTGKSCCSRARREQTPPVSLRLTDPSGMGPLAVRKSFRGKLQS